MTEEFKPGDRVFYQNVHNGKIEVAVLRRIEHQTPFGKMWEVTPLSPGDWPTWTLENGEVEKYTYLTPESLHHLRSVADVATTLKTESELLSETLVVTNEMAKNFTLAVLQLIAVLENQESDN
jgi:hypothetical protein